MISLLSVSKNLYFEKSFKTKNEIQELPKNIISTVYSIRQIKDKNKSVKIYLSTKDSPKKTTHFQIFYAENQQLGWTRHACVLQTEFSKGLKVGRPLRP